MMGGVTHNETPTAQRNQAHLGRRVRHCTLPALHVTKRQPPYFATNESAHVLTNCDYCGCCTLRVPETTWPKLVR